MIGLLGVFGFLTFVTTLAVVEVVTNDRRSALGRVLMLLVWLVLVAVTLAIGVSTQGGAS